MGWVIIHVRASHFPACEFLIIAMVAGSYSKCADPSETSAIAGTSLGRANFLTTCAPRDLNLHSSRNPTMLISGGCSGVVAYPCKLEKFDGRPEPATGTSYFGECFNLRNICDLDVRFRACSSRCLARDFHGPGAQAVHWRRCGVSLSLKFERSGPVARRVHWVGSWVGRFGSSGIPRFGENVADCRYRFSTRA